jgi:tetratricopeptide (TPR) repeat protein
LLIAALAIYARKFGYGFVAYDDNKYVYENPVLRAGLTVASFRWALTTFYFANWCPITWISYLADVQFFGMHPGEMHAVNVALHGLTAVVLFLALVRLTGQADSRTLFEHGLAVTDRNYFLANNLGVILEKNGQSTEAAALFRQAIAFNPNHAPAHVNLGLDLLRSGHLDEGRRHLLEAVRLNPNLPMAQAGLGVVAAGKAITKKRGGVSMNRSGWTPTRRRRKIICALSCCTSAAPGRRQRTAQRRST